MTKKTFASMLIHYIVGLVLQVLIMKFSILLLVCLVGLASVSHASPDKTRIQQLKIDLKDKTLDQLRDEKAEVSGK